MALPFSLDVTVFRQRAGLASIDASKDALIEAAVNMTVEALEDTLDRKLVKIERTQRFTHERGLTLPLDAYPVDVEEDLVLEGSESANTVPGYHVDLESGLLQLDSWNGDGEVQFTYTGGYATLPSMLYLAVLSGFDTFYAIADGSASQAQAGIKSVTVPDVGTVSYFESAYGGGSADSVPPAFGAVAGNLRPFFRVWA